LHCRSAPFILDDAEEIQILNAVQQFDPRTAGLCRPCAKLTIFEEV
jgi:hypothetical protein